MARNRVYVANFLGNSILAFNNARTVSGDVAPDRSISNTVTPISPVGLFIDPISDRLYVTSDNSVLVYDNASGLSGANITPNRTLTGVSTTLNAPTGIFVDTTRNLLYVANAGVTNQVLVFNNAATANGNIPPDRTISITSASAGLFVDVMADRLYVASGNSIRIYDDASTADSVSPDRTISGGGSMLNQPRDIFVDTGTDRLYVANATDDTVLVFDDASTASGSPAPDRILNLPVFTDPRGIYVDVTPIVIGSTGTLDGYVLDDNSSVNTDPVGGGPKTGDLDPVLGPRLVARQFYSFGWTGIPSTVNVRSATLRLYQANVEGFPYANLGSVVVDHVDYGAALDSADYDAPALTSNTGTLSTNDAEEYKTLNVTTSVASDLAGRTRSQFRLRFSAENNVNFEDDYVQFTDAEDFCCTANKPPQLVITILP
jgi:DNA-binding beta-propeller fold protein YncE